MAEAKLFWVLYDSLYKLQSNPLSTADAQTAVLKMDLQQLERFFIWTTGWDNWHQLKFYLESDQKNFVSTFTVPIPKKEGTKSFSSIRLNEETISRLVKQEQTNESKSFDGDEITWTNIQKPTLDFSSFTKKSLRNREARHELKIEVLLISPKGNTFRSSSKNISLSGSLLEDTIPLDFYSTTFDVVVISSKTKDPLKARVKLTARAIGNNGGLTQRIQYHNPTALQIQSLKILLEDYEDLKKKAAAG